MPYNNSRRPSFRGQSSRGNSSGYFGGRSNNSRRGKTKERIDVSRFIRATKPQEQEVYVPANSFADFAIEAVLHQNLAARGYQVPSPIQDQSIPHGLAGKSVVGIANTGTGKTAAFGIPLLDRLIKNQTDAALVVAPTRELAQQIEDEFRNIGGGSKIRAALLIGGSPMGPQLRDLRNNPRIVIGTPGRIKDHIERHTLKLAGFNVVVLDEVDRMLDMGFINDMRTILSQLADDRQSYFFSATLDHKVKALIDSFSTEYVTISVKTGDTADSVEQDIIAFSGKDDKNEKLHDTLIDPSTVKAIVFHETKHGAERLSDELVARGFKADAIHGGRSQGQRQRALSRFKKNEVNILVATDVAARGIDVIDITHVINYSLPQTYDDYVHRIGRAGRAGRTGKALTFVEKSAR